MLRKQKLQLVFRGLGFVLLMIPFLFQWYIIDADRYVSMIRGPYPFSHLGSFTYQLVGTMIVPLMFAISSWCFASSYSSPRNVTWSEAPYRGDVLRNFALAFAIIGVLFLALAFIPPLISS